jgi:hypothetical protein
MTRSIVLASIIGLMLVGPAMAQDATGGGGAGGGGGGAVVESPQPGQTRTPPGTNSNTPGMATPSARLEKLPPPTGMTEPPANGVRAVSTGTNGSTGSK